MQPNELIALARRAVGWSPSLERAATAWLVATPSAEALLIEYQEARAALMAARQPLPGYPGVAPSDPQRELARSEWQPDPDGPGVRRWNPGGSVSCPGVSGAAEFAGSWVYGPGSGSELIAARVAVAAYQAWYDGEYQAAREAAVTRLWSLTVRFERAETACYEAIMAFSEEGGF